MNSTKLNLTALAILVLLFTACQKGEIIKGTPYGVININGATITGDSSIAPIVVEYSGKPSDTMNARKALSACVVQAGEVKLALRHGGTGEVFFDTSFTLQPAQTININYPFFYAGGRVQKDDFTKRPANDSVLVRFIIQDTTLPDVINLSFSLYYTQGGTQIRPTPKKLDGVNKKDFSEFIQFSSPVALAPTGATNSRYIIEATNAATGEKVMAYNSVAAQNSMGYVITNPTASSASQWTQWTNNEHVITMGIGPRSGASSGIKQPKVIFSHVAP